LATEKNTIFLRVKISFAVKRIATDVLLFFTEFCLYNKQKNTWVLGNTRFISRVEHDIMFNTRNKSGISAHPCIILYLFFQATVMCDICVLYLLKKKYFYRNMKYQYVDNPDASTNEDEADFPFLVGTSSILTVS
jgi:hypothetical protein